MFKKNFQSQNNPQKKARGGKPELAIKFSIGNSKNSDSNPELKPRNIASSLSNVQSEDNKLYQVDFKVLEKLLNARLNPNSTSGGGNDSQKSELMLQNQSSNQSEKQLLKSSSLKNQQNMREKHRNSLPMNTIFETSLDRSNNLQNTSLAKSKSIYTTQQSRDSSGSDTELKGPSPKLNTKKINNISQRSPKYSAEQEKKLTAPPNQDQNRNSVSTNNIISNPGSDLQSLRNSKNPINLNEYGFNHPVTPKTQTQTPQNQKNKTKSQAETKPSSSQAGTGERHSIDPKKYLDSLIASNPYNKISKGGNSLLERKKSLQINDLLQSPTGDGLNKPTFFKHRKRSIDHSTPSNTKGSESIEMSSKKGEKQSNHKAKTPRSQTNTLPFNIEEVQQQAAVQKNRPSSSGIKTNSFYTNERFLGNQWKTENSQCEYSKSSINISQQKPEFTSSHIEPANLIFSKHKSFEYKLDQGVAHGSPFFNPYPQKKNPAGFHLDLSFLGNSNSFTSSKNTSQSTKPILGITNEDLLVGSPNTTIKAAEQDSNTEVSKSMKSISQEKKLMHKERLQAAQAKGLSKKHELRKFSKEQNKPEKNENIKGELQDLKGKVDKMQESIFKFQESFSKIMGAQEEVNKKLLAMLVEESSSRGTENKRGSELETIRDYCSDCSGKMSSRTPDSLYQSLSDRNRKSSFGGTSSRGNTGSKQKKKNSHSQSHSHSHRGQKKDGLEADINPLATLGEEKMASKTSSNKDQLSNSSERDPI